MLPSKDILTLTLFTLKEARENLAQDFIIENPEIYDPMFKYEKSNEQMMLAKEKYIMIWLDSHWNLIETLLKNQEIESTIQNEVRYRFAEVFLSLLEKFDADGRNQASPLAIRLLKEKIDNLEKLLNLGDKHENRINKLRYDAHRHKIIFERKFAELKGE